MAESIILFLFRELSTCLHEQQDLLRGFEDEVEFIHGEMGHMRAFLRVADAKEESDPQLKEWVRQVREIAYDTEGVLETYMLRFAHRHAHGFGDSLKRIRNSMKKLRAKHQIASQIKTIKSRVENASKSHQAYTDKYSVVLSRSTSYDDGRGYALRLEETDVVGIEGPKKQLLKWLSSAGCGLEVISVVGMGGLGKTTLVKKVYDDTSLKMNFDHHAWITVSESFNVENLLEDIVKRLVKEVKQPPPAGLETMNDDDKREFIYNFLQNKNYIIVLDDVWRTNAWEAVKYAFPRSMTNGRGCIIITTRFNNIGHATFDTNGRVYKLEPLPEEDSKKLFYKKAFSGNSCPPYLKEVSESILKRCNGWPLAIVVIGGLLATKHNRIDEWEMFNRSLRSELVGDNFKRMWKLLSLSFYDLPYYLKACFLYLSIFSEDQVIEKATVIRLWTAEGFVEAKEWKTVEETAEGYLNELVNRSLLQVTGTFRDGRPRNFHIHDLAREYIISKAREQNMAIVHSGEEKQWTDRIRRLALHSSINFRQPINTLEHLRSLIFLGALDSNWEPILYSILRAGCRMLKVLDLRGAPLDTIPNEVFKLYHLRYLSLRDTKVKVIPKSIGNLGKLEPLDLKRSMVTELPIEILNLQRLRNLLLYRYNFISGRYRLFSNVQSFKAPYDMGNLLSLQKLCYIDADVKIVREIGKLTQLKRLGITKLRRQEGSQLCSSLAKLTSLRSLTITASKEDELMDLEYSLSSSTFPYLRTLELRGCLAKIPQWITCLNALTRINLGWSRLQEDSLESLQGLPNLLVLDMDCAYVGQELNFKNGGFQRLEELYLRSLRGLRGVTVEQGSMPMLQRLEVWDCKSIIEVPMGIEHLTCLHYVYFMDMAEEFVERLLDETRRRNNQRKLAHIPIFGVYNIVNGEFKYRL